MRVRPQVQGVLRHRGGSGLLTAHPPRARQGDQGEATPYTARMTESAQTDALVVYDVAGPRGQQVVVAPRSLATPVEDLRCFWDFSDSEGARIGFWGPDEVIVASFPGWYRADCELARLPEGWLPLPDRPGERWEDFDQEWYLAAMEEAGWVYVFQSDLVELTARVEGTARATPAPAPSAPGAVMVGGVEATWFRLPSEAFRTAWAQAQAQARHIVASRGPAGG